MIGKKITCFSFKEERHEFRADPNEILGRVLFAGQADWSLGSFKIQDLDFFPSKLFKFFCTKLPFGDAM